MSNSFEVYNMIVSALFAFWIAIVIYYRFVTNSQINSLIIEHYHKQGIKVNDISKLTYVERIQYGVPINLIMRVYGFIFTIHKLGDNHFRMVEVVDNNGKEQIKYIDLYVKKRSLISCNEFKSVEF